MSNFWIDRRRMHSLKVYYLLESQTHTRDILLRQSPYDLYDDISNGRYCPDGSLAVYYGVEYQGWKTAFYGNGHIVTPSKYTLPNFCEFEIALDGPFTLRMNRYYVIIDNSSFQWVEIGGSLSFGIGCNGSRHLGNGVYQPCGQPVF